jgi:ubiquitin C-terminal hydrolase
MTSEELKTRLEITINAHTSYSNKFNIDFLPSMIRNSGASSSGSGRSGAYTGYDYEYRDGLRASGVNRRMVYLPTTHLIDEVFPKFEKRYKIPATVLFTNTAKYIGYIKYANSILYEEDGRENKKFIHEDSNIMINRNIKFILKELFVKNRILINVNTISGLDPGLGAGIGNGNKQFNQEYYIETFAQPVAANGKIFKEGDVEIERLKAKEDAIRSEIDTERKNNLESTLTESEKRKNKFNIVRKEKQIGVSIQKRTEYKYGEVTTNLKTLIKNRERYAGIVENSSSSSGSSGRMGSMDYADTYRTYTQKLKETESAIKAMEIDTYIVTIPDMSLIPSLLDNGKDNPQFKLLIKKMSEIDIGTDRVKSSSMFGVPSKAQCASDKREIERMFDEILNAARKQVLQKEVLQKDNNSDHAASAQGEGSNYLQKMKEAYANVMDKKGSAEFFNNVSTKEQLAKMSRTYKGTVKTPGDNDETPIAILCRTRMGKFLVLFTLFESDTLKLHRPNIASSSMVHIDVVPIKGLDGVAKEVKEGGQERAVGVFKVDKMPLDIKVNNAELILNLNANIPPAYFRMSGDYRAYNEYKTRNIVYKKFDFFAVGVTNVENVDSRNYAASVNVIGAIIKDIAIMRDALMKIDIASPKPITDFFTKIQDLFRALSEFSKLSALSKVITDKGKMAAIINVMLTRAEGIENLISSANDAVIEFFNATELSQNKKSSAITEYDNARMAFIDNHNTRIRDTAIADATKIRDDAIIVATTKYESAKTAATRKKAANDAAYGIARDKADKSYETAIIRATTTFNSTKNNIVYTAAKAEAEQAYTLAIDAAKATAAKTSATADFTTEMTAADKTRTTAIDDATTVYTNAKNSAEQTYIKESKKASAIIANNDNDAKNTEFTKRIDDIKKQHIYANTAADKAVANYKYMGSIVNKYNATKNKNRADAIVKEDEATSKTLAKLAAAANVDYSKPVKLFRIGPMQTSMDDKLAKKLASVQTTFNDIFYFDDAGIQGYNAAKQNSERLKTAKAELIAAEKAKADINLNFFAEQFNLDKTHYDEAVDEYKNVTNAFITKHKDKNRTAYLAYETALRLADNEYAAAATAAAKKPAKDTPFHVKTIEAVKTPPTHVEYSIPAVETVYTIAKDSAFETFAAAVKAKGPINEIKPDLAAIADAKKIRDEKKAINEISERALEVPTMEDLKVQAKIDGLKNQIAGINKEINIDVMKVNDLKTKYAFKLIETDFKKIRANVDNASANTAAAAAATATATATSKKSESKFDFDDVELLKRIIEDVEESDERKIDLDMAATNSKIPATSPASPAKLTTEGKVAKTAENEPTSDEQGKQLAAKMKAKGVTIITDNTRGLQNHGNTCYMNAALQLIFSMTKIKDAITATTTGYSATSTFNYLKQYMEKMNGGNDVQPANDLFDSVKQFKNPFGYQEDSHEMLIYLLDGVDENKTKTINNALKCSDIETQVVTMDFKGDISSCRDKNFSTDLTRRALYNEMNNERVLYCKILNNVKKNIHSINIGDSTTPTTFKTIYDSYLSETDIIGTETNIMDEILYPYFKKDNISDPYTECAPIFNVVERTDAEKNLESSNKTHKFKYVKKQDKLKFYPEQKYLIIQLKRFSSISGVQKRISTSIDLTNSEIPANNGTPDVFRIMGCICHHGSSTDRGHYTYVRFENGAPTTVYDDGYIYKYSDYSKGRAVDTDCYVLLFERVKNAKAGGARETKRCRLNLNSNNKKYTRRHNKNKDRIVPTVTVIKR